VEHNPSLNGTQFLIQQAGFPLLKGKIDVCGAKLPTFRTKVASSFFRNAPHPAFSMVIPTCDVSDIGIFEPPHFIVHAKPHDGPCLAFHIALQRAPK